MENKVKQLTASVAILAFFLIFSLGWNYKNHNAVNEVASTSSDLQKDFKVIQEDFKAISDTAGLLAQLADSVASAQRTLASTISFVKQWPEEKDSVLNEIKLQNKKLDRYIVQVNSLDKLLKGDPKDSSTTNIRKMVMELKLTVAEQEAIISSLKDEQTQTKNKYEILREQIAESKHYADSLKAANDAATKVTKIPKNLKQK